jgi:dienelactone hydrolase
MRRDVTFESEGAEMRGWYYTPDTASPWPLVVMAHGFSATKEMVADRYADVFTEAWMEVDNVGLLQQVGAMDAPAA